MNAEWDFAKTWVGALNERTKAHDAKIVGLYKQFIYSWISFVFIGRCFSGGGERVMIDSLKRELKPSFATEFYNRNTALIKKLDALKVKNDTRPNNPTEKADKLTQSLNSSNFNGVEVLNAVIDVLYVVRCNLFHGPKVWARQRDNNIMDVASPLMLALVEQIQKDPINSLSNPSIIS